MAELFEALHHDVIEAATQARLAALYPPPQLADSELPQKLAALPAAMHAMACALESRPPRVVVLSLAHTHAERVVVIMPAAGAHVKLTDFDLPQERAYLLLHLRGLQTLDLRDCDLHTCADAFAEVLRCTLGSLHSLDLRGIQVESVSEMVAVARVLGSLTRLTQLHLKGWDADDCGIEIYSPVNIGRVTDLGAALAPALNQLMRLVRISLADELRWEVDAVVLAPALRPLTRLVDLSLGWSVVTDAGLALMEPTLHDLATLTRLVLSSNNLSAAGAHSLVFGLRALVRLRARRQLGRARHVAARVYRRMCHAAHAARAPETGCCQSARNYPTPRRAACARQAALLKCAAKVACSHRCDAARCSARHQSCARGLTPSSAGPKAQAPSRRHRLRHGTRRRRGRMCGLRWRRWWRQCQTAAGHDLNTARKGQ